MNFFNRIFAWFFTEQKDSLTPQQIFDIAYLGLKRQGKQSHYGASGYKYCNPEGLHCGIGFLVSDEVGKEWDNQKNLSIAYIVSRRVKGVKPWMKRHLNLLEAIQESHDSIGYWGDAMLGWEHPVTGFEAKFGRIARAFQLTIPTMEQQVP